MTRDRKVVYYRDPLTDDFAGTHIETGVIDETYPYKHGWFWNACSAALYAFAVPIVWFLHRVIGGVRFVDRGKRKQVKGPCFLYGNHTAMFDAYTPALLSFSRRADVLAGADAFSIRGIRTIVQMLGGLAIPNRRSGMKHFMDAVRYEYARGRDIAIFPEAHIWPYYTGVRPFTATSFSYPVKLGAPVFAYFVAYSEPKGLEKLFRKARTRVYLSDPIYPDPKLSHKDAQKDLRDRVYAFMEETAKAHSTYAVIEYVRLFDDAADGAPQDARRPAL